MKINNTPEPPENQNTSPAKAQSPQGPTNCARAVVLAVMAALSGTGMPAEAATSGAPSCEEVYSQTMPPKTSTGLRANLSRPAGYTPYDPHWGHIVSEETAELIELIKTHGLSWDDLPSKYRGVDDYYHRDIARVAIEVLKKHPEDFGKLPGAVKGDCGVLREVIDPSNFHLIDPRLMDSGLWYQVYKQALLEGNGSKIYSKIPKGTLSREDMEYILRSYATKLADVPPEYRGNTEISESLIAQGVPLSHFPPNIRENPETVLYALKESPAVHLNNPLSIVPPNLRGNLDIWKGITAIDPSDFSKAPDVITGNPDAVTALIKENPGVFPYTTFTDHPIIAATAVKRDPEMFSHVPETLQCSPAFMNAVAAHLPVRYMPECYLNNPNIVSAAKDNILNALKERKREGKAIEIDPEDLKVLSKYTGYRKFFIELVQLNGLLLEYGTAELRGDPVVVHWALSDNIDAHSYVLYTDDIREHPEIMYLLMKDGQIRPKDLSPKLWSWENYLLMDLVYKMYRMEMRAKEATWASSYMGTLHATLEYSSDFWTKTQFAGLPMAIDIAKSTEYPLSKRQRALAELSKDMVLKVLATLGSDALPLFPDYKEDPEALKAASRGDRRKR